MTDDGELNGIPSYHIGDSRVQVDENGIARLKGRYHLKNGYILDKNVSPKEIFTNITIQEYVNYNTKNGVIHWPNSLLWDRIIDMDPFTEYYYFGGLDKPERIFTLGEINELIENGTLETVFIKLK